MRKFFFQDKNYILYGAQLDNSETLLEWMVDYSRKYYMQQYNPLGLMDDTMLEVQKIKDVTIEDFSEFYEMISAIYRYKNGSNQLEFLFDGMDHYDKYSLEWENEFKRWVNELFYLEPFLKTVLQIVVFEVEGHSRYLALKRMNQYLFQHFNLKVYRYKGIVEKGKAA